MASKKKKLDTHIASGSTLAPGTTLASVTEATEKLKAQLKRERAKVKELKTDLLEADAQFKGREIAVRELGTRLREALAARQELRSALAMALTGTAETTITGGE